MFKTFKQFCEYRQQNPVNPALVQMIASPNKQKDALKSAMLYNKIRRSMPNVTSNDIKDAMDAVPDDDKN